MRSAGDVNEISYRCSRKLSNTAPYRVDDWFKPYSLSQAFTNPLTWPEEIAYLYEKWENF